MLHVLQILRMSTFNINNIPSQKGKIIIVTGSNIGLGYETALELAKKEATVIMACRNMDKAKAAKNKILASVPNANMMTMKLDLGDLASVKNFSENFLEKYDKLDILINNAGIMIPPYQLTKDGFESQFGVNHLGHFYLTGLLLDRVNATPDSRIVVLSSVAHVPGRINFDDLQSKEKYSAVKAYQQSKLANIMFAFELQRRLEKAGHQTIAVAAHPGVSNTNLGRHVPRILYYILLPLLSFMIHSPNVAAMPTLLAALDDDVKGGEYFGPTGKREMKGPAGRAKIASHAKDTEVARRLWEVSEELTGIKYLN